MEELDIELCRTLFPEIFHRFDEDADEYEIAEAIGDFVSEQGKTAFSFDWEGGGITVYRHCDHYFTSSTENGFYGPFDSMTDAVEGELVLDEEGRICTNSLTEAISCTEWPDEKLILQLNLKEYEQPYRLSINGSVWKVYNLIEEQEKIRENRGTSGPPDPNQLRLFGE